MVASIVTGVAILLLGGSNLSPAVKKAQFGTPQQQLYQQRQDNDFNANLQQHYQMQQQFNQMQQQQQQLLQKR